MSLIVEDGTGLATAESYCSTAFADTYHINRGNGTWATITPAQKEEALRRATDYMQQVYHGRWLGYRKTATQALDWPRLLVKNDDAYAYSSYYLDTNSVPVIVQNALAELAWKAAQGELAPDLSQKVIREKIDVIEVEYSPNGVQYTRYRAIDNLLSSLLGQGGTFRQVMRA